MTGHDASVTPAMPWLAEGPDTPFIFIRHKDGQVNVTGQTQGLVGHRLDIPGDETPRGQFGEWSWDGQSLTAAVDPLGFFSLYVYANGDQVGISPSLTQLLANGADAEVNETALAVFHRIGFFVQNDTPFKHIRTLPPDGRLHWQNGILSIGGGVPDSPKESALSREQFVDGFIDVFRTSMQRLLQCWPAPIDLPLTGGRDSRHILLEMLRLGRTPATGVTFHHGGDVYNAETQAARAISERAGIQHALLGHPRRRVRDSVRAMLMTQLCADEHSQMMVLHDWVTGRGNACIDGIAGDVLSSPNSRAGQMVPLARAGKYAEIAQLLTNGHAAVISRQTHSGGAGSVYSDTLHDAAIERIAETLRAHEDTPNPFQAFWFWNRTRREISYTSTAVMGNAPAVLCPYLEPEFVELGLSLPFDMDNGTEIHDAAIQRAYPEFADIPYIESYSNSQPTPSMMQRAGNALDALSVTTLTKSESCLRSIKNMLKNNGLSRPHADIYQLHADLVSGMNAGRAERLLQVDKQLSTSAPKGEQVVTDVYA